MTYKGIDRRSKAKVFGCLEMHQRDIGLFFGNLYRKIEEEKNKMKAYLVTDVKNGKPTLKEIDDFDERIAQSDYVAIFNPEDEQHYQKERMDR